MGKTFNLGIKLDLLNKVTAPLKKIVTSFRKLGKVVNNVAAKFNKLKQAAGAAGNKMLKAGKSLTRKVTLPILALGGAVIKMAMDFNKGMANVASLLDGNKSAVASRVKSLGKSVQGLAIKFGVSTTDLTKGLYDVVSALGDTKDTMFVLGLTTKVAKAGVTSTKDAFQLLSAVTKGYGDTSKEAFQKTADLAFQTVKLGQTTFPQLAQAIGRVIPLASTLKIKQTEVFGVYATLTGVMEDANKVSTAYSGILSAMLRPTESMIKAADKLGFASSIQMIKQKGLVGTLKLLNEHTKGNAMAVGKLFAEKDAMNAFFTLTGAQAKTLDEKMKKLENSTGATDRAFKAQTEGVNKIGFSWKRFIATLQVFGQKVGQMLLPILDTLISIITPIINFFQNLPGPIQKAIITILLLAAAIGPLLAAFGALMKVMAVFKILMTFIAANPIVLIIAAIIVAVILLIKYWKQVKTFFIKIWKFIVKLFKLAWKAIKILPIMWIPLILIKQWGKIGGFFKNLWGSIVDVAKETWQTIFEVINVVINAIKDAINFLADLLGGAGREIVGVVKQQQLERTREGFNRGGVLLNNSRADIIIRVKSDKGSSTQIDSVKKTGNANVNVKNQSTVGNTR